MIASELGREEQNYCDRCKSGECVCWALDPALTPDERHIRERQNLAKEFNDLTEALGLGRRLVEP